MESHWAAKRTLRRFAYDIFHMSSYVMSLCIRPCVSLLAAIQSIASAFKAVSRARSSRSDKCVWIRSARIAE